MRLKTDIAMEMFTTGKYISKLFRTMRLFVFIEELFPMESRISRY